MSLKPATPVSFDDSKTAESDHKGSRSLFYTFCSGALSIRYTMSPKERYFLNRSTRLCLSTVHPSVLIIQTQPHTFTWAYLIFTSALPVSQGRSTKTRSQNTNLSDRILIWRLLFPFVFSEKLQFQEVFWLLPGDFRRVRSESLCEWTFISEPTDRWHTAVLTSQHTLVHTGHRSGSWRCNWQGKCD